jgi:hypothetical protein
MSAIARLRTLAPALLILGALAAQAADVTNPAEVGGVHVNPNAGVPDDLDVSWSAVAFDVSGNAETVSLYKVYRGDTPDFVPDKSGGSNLVGTSASTTFTDAGARTDGTDHYYLVTAEDAAGNESASRASTVTTPPVLSGSWTDTTIELNWTDADPVGNVLNYKVYYGKAPGEYEFVDDVGLSTSHSLTGLELWVNWYVAVTAVDLNGNESAFSNEHIDAVAGRVRHRVHDEDRLCWGASKCTPTDPDKLQRADGWQLLVPTRFPEGDWTRVLVTYTLDSRLCEPPAGQNVDRCVTGNPCLTPPCNGGYNTCGDPWDRIAHLFLVLDDCVNQGGSCRTHNNLELMRAATPFGTDADPPDGRGIIGPRNLTLDVTPFAPLLTGEKHLGAEIGHFVQAGWYVTVEFEFSERPDEASPEPPADGIQVLFFGGTNPPTASLAIPSTATQVYTRLFTSGHGGNAACDGGSNDGGDCSLGCPGGSCGNCDEFCHRTNQIVVDGNPVWSEIPWRGDCFVESGTGQTCNQWNSCGFPSCAGSRAGWCPGYIMCHHDAPCDNDIDMTPFLLPGGAYDIDYNVFPVNGSWSISLVAYWYE